MKATTLASLEGKVRPTITKRLPPKSVVRVYSRGRRHFLKQLDGDIPGEPYTPPKALERTLWGIKFRTPIFNAAGMFKDGECAEVVDKQGAGAYLGGTGTYNPRTGNEVGGILNPFTPLPLSNTSLNNLGLPNLGDPENSITALILKNKIGCPVGWSVMGSPDYHGDEKLRFLVRSMKEYEASGVAFIEINESCPNTQHGLPQEDDLAERLRYVKENFINRRNLDSRPSYIPVIVKFSTDTDPEQVPPLLDLLFELGYSGVNFGNTSKEYAERREKIDPRERKLYDFFTQKLEGGVGGAPLRESSLELAASAAEYLRAGPPSQEFHVIRTGGIETLRDVVESEAAGISLTQWFTGYFRGLEKHGHDVYRNLFASES